jgi:putative FmdB family regulatory protein
VPIYEYKCSNSECGLDYEINKSFKDAEREEPCSKCGDDLQRVISAVRTNTSNCQFQSHFNYAFGKEVTSANQMKDLVRAHEGETGRKLIEVGTEKTDSMKKNAKSLKLTEDETKRAHEILREYR